MTTSQQFAAPPPLPTQKPSSGVIALAIINIIYAALARLWCGFNSMMQVAIWSNLSDMFANMPDMPEGEMPDFSFMTEGPMRAYAMINGFVLLILGAALLAAGIGMLKLKPWSRPLALGVAAGEILWAFISLAITFLFIFPTVAEFLPEEIAESPIAVLAVIAKIFGTLLSLVLPVTLLISLNIRSIKEQFEPKESSSFGSP